MVYLIHLDEKYKHAQHYIGFAEQDVNGRLEDHKAGRGSKFLAAVNRAGIKYAISRLWPDGDRKLERLLKNRKKIAPYCPICNPRINDTNTNKPVTARRQVHNDRPGVPGKKNRKRAVVLRCRKT